MQPRATLSFRLIGLATCLLLGTIGCTAIHDDGTLPPRAVRHIENVGSPARTASERLLEAAARAHGAEAHADATLGEVFLPKLDADGSCWRSDRQLALKTATGGRSP